MICRPGLALVVLTQIVGLAHGDEARVPTTQNTSEEGLTLPPQAETLPETQLDFAPAITGTYLPPKPERIVVHDPSWKLSFEHRSRLETLQPDFRIGQRNASALVSRTLVQGEYRFRLGGDHKDSSLFLELADSRAWGSEAAEINTTSVNALAVLQAYARTSGQGLFLPSGKYEVKAGRFTMDVGSRRLIARNRYRNTINGFTGLHAQWNALERFSAEAFATMPVLRRPTGGEEIASNDYELDRELTNTLFWGVHGALTKALAPCIGLNSEKMGMETGLYGLHERDGVSETRNRSIVTLVARVFHRPSPGSFDGDLELAGQVGRARRTTDPSDTDDLDHLAAFVHGEGGFTWDAKSAPRAALLYDYATGDTAPLDDTSGRFDTLFGARRFDFGPTGIYGIFARGNLHSPGARITADPGKEVSLMATYRAAWLAAARDAWVGAGLRDATGQSGTFLGHQIEGSFTWKPSKALQFELGLAHFFRGDFGERVPDGGTEDSTYGYGQLRYRFGWER